MNNVNLLFSSVGDNTNFDELYTGNNITYDIYVIYYGDNEENFNRYKSKVKFIEKRKGSKWQNFKYFYDKYLNIIIKYEYYFIIDDDIIINNSEINKLFSIAKKYKLSICGPAFKKESKISHEITLQKNNTLLSYTNFVEVNVPLFNKSALNKLMKYLDYNLIGWGIDYLYIWCNGLDKTNAYAIIHSIGCINPKDTEKNNTREMTLIKNWDMEIKLWFLYADKIKCPKRYEIIEYYSI